MSKGPDLSAFPIPRKGGARPIAMDDAATNAPVEDQRVEPKRERPPAEPDRLPPPAPPEPEVPAQQKPAAQPSTARKEPTVAAVSATSGQTVATTVKLDENRYLRLADAGRPGPGRLKRLTIQQIMIEALDEWFERRGL
jgi:hypothetical protein